MVRYVHKNTFLNRWWEVGVECWCNYNITMTEYISSAYFGNLYLISIFLVEGKLVTVSGMKMYMKWCKGWMSEPGVTPKTTERNSRYLGIWNYEVWKEKPKYQIISPMFSFRMQKRINKNTQSNIINHCRCTWPIYKSSFLTHCDRVTHICVGKTASIGSDNGLSATNHYVNQCWNIVDWTFSNKLQILIQKIHLKVSSGKRCPSCFGLTVLNH